MVPYLPQIWKQLLTDAPFAWHQRNEAAHGVQFTLLDLVDIDQTVAAYLDALGIAKRKGARLHEALNFEDWGSVFISVVLGLRFEDDALLAVALAAIGEDLERAAELEHAIRWPTTYIADKRVVTWQTHDNPAIRRAALGAVYTDVDHELHYRLKTESHPWVLARLLERAGDQRYWHETIAHMYNIESPEVKFYALRAGVLFGDAEAYPRLKQLAREEGPYRAKALELYLRAAQPEATQSMLVEILKTEDSKYLHCQCIAWAGYPEWVTLLMPLLEEPTYARTAGYAFSLLTGVDLIEAELSVLEAEQRNSSQTPQNDNYRSANESDWPWPAAEKIQAWWQRQAAQFNPGTRYLAGYPLTQPYFEVILIEGTQPQRQAVALERSLQTPGVAIFDIQAYAVWQQQRLKCFT